MAQKCFDIYDISCPFSSIERKSRYVGCDGKWLTSIHLQLFNYTVQKDKLVYRGSTALMLDFVLFYNNKFV